MPKVTACYVPTAMSDESAKLHRAFHKMHCARNVTAHRCAGSVTVNTEGVILSCPLCGDHRSLYPEGEPGAGPEEKN